MTARESHPRRFFQSRIGSAGMRFPVAAATAGATTGVASGVD